MEVIEGGFVEFVSDNNGMITLGCVKIQSMLQPMPEPRRIRDPQSPAERLIIKPELVRRESTGKKDFTARTQSNVASEIS
jgi:hypothetical protein